MSLLLLFMTLTKCNKASNVRRCVTISTGMQVTFTRVGLSPRSGSGGESSHSTFKIFFSPSCVAHLWTRCGNADPLVKRSSTCKCSTENRNTYLDGHISWSTCFYLNISVRWYHRWCVEWVCVAIDRVGLCLMCRSMPHLSVYASCVGLCLMCRSMT